MEVVSFPHFAVALHGQMAHEIADTLGELLVVQTLLEGLLVDELGPRAAADLYGRSALLLETARWPREALRAYAMAEDFASVARLLQQSTATLAVAR